MQLALSLFVLAVAQTPTPKPSTPPPPKPAQPPPSKPAQPPPGTSKSTDAQLKKVERVTDTPEYKLAVWTQINGSGKQIDSCTQRYLDINPGAKGVVQLSYELLPDGKVKKADANTALKGSDNLRVCLKDVARRWKFPPTGPTQVSSTLTINVMTGHKFTMLKPGEKPAPPPPPPPKKEGDDGFIRFQPGLPPTDQQVEVGGG